MTALAPIARDGATPFSHRSDTVPARRHRPADGGERVARALTAHAARAGCTVALRVLTVEPWASATFAGSVVTLALTAPQGPALSDWLAALPEAEIPLGRHLVADIAVEADGTILRLLICADVTPE